MQSHVSFRRFQFCLLRIVRMMQASYEGQTETSFCDVFSGYASMNSDM